VYFSTPDTDVNAVRTARLGSDTEFRTKTIRNMKFLFALLSNYSIVCIRIMVLLQTT
jgi:hypothetical protein